MEQELFSQLLERLPNSSQSRARRYQSALSAYNYIAGRLLLQQGLDSLGYNSDLEKIEYQENGKPSLPQVQFNISHSGHQVICGFASKGDIGVDIEKIEPIDLEDFVSMFSALEWAAIKASDNPLRSFYWFWTRKESIIKALGLSLSFLHQIDLDVTLGHFEVDGVRWYLRGLDVEGDFIGSVCCHERIGEIEVVEFEL